MKNSLTLVLLIAIIVVFSKIPLPIGEASLSLESFQPPNGIYYPGDEVTSSLEVKNVGTKKATFWVGYSVQDKAGHWYDIPAKQITLAGGEKTTKSMTWIVPTGTILTGGSYLAVMALWDRIPHEKNATELAREEAIDSFFVFNRFEDFSSFDDTYWKRDGHRLGLSRLHPRNIRIEDSQLHIIIPAGTINGGGISTRELYLYGSYQARIKLPLAPSSITGFFLYHAPDYYHEIDIEIYNDSRGEAFFTTYARGERTNTSTHFLAFDPTTDFHVYRFDYYPQGVTFYVDDVEVVNFDDGLTDTPMYLMINTWFPDWLEGIPPKEEVRTVIDWIRY